MTNDNISPTLNSWIDSILVQWYSNFHYHVGSAWSNFFRINWCHNFFLYDGMPSRPMECICDMHIEWNLMPVPGHLPCLQPLPSCVHFRFASPSYSRVTLSLTHRDRVTHMCVDDLNINCSDNGLSPGRSQTIIWNIAGILSIGPLETNFCGTLIESFIFSSKKGIWKCRLENGGRFVSAAVC